MSGRERRSRPNDAGWQDARKLTKRAPGTLHVHARRERVFLDEVTARLDDVAHQLGEAVVGLVDLSHLDLQERPHIGVERRFPQLLRVHLLRARGRSALQFLFPLWLNYARLETILAEDQLRVGIVMKQGKRGIEKLHPKLRMIANGSEIVNGARAELSSIVVSTIAPEKAYAAKGRWPISPSRRCCGHPETRQPSAESFRARSVES